MRRTTLIILLIAMLMSGQQVLCQNMKMLLVPTPGSADSNLLYLSRGLNAIMMTDISNEVRRIYPCVDVTDPQSIQYCLGELRLQATPEFGGRDIRSVVSKIAQSLTNPDFAVKYSVYVNSEDLAQATVLCSNSEGEILADFTEPFSPGAVDGKSIIKPVKRLMEELSKHEICPFTGTVNVEVKSERDESSSSSTPCDAGLIVTDVEIKSNSTLRWELVKESLEGASGTVTYDLKENFKTVISNSCYVCKDGTKGFAKITDTKESEAKVQGLSNESISDGAQVSDARIRITFLDDGTYLLTVKATSEKGPMKVTTEKKVDGPCTGNNENEPPDTKTKSMDVPFTAVFGPYRGTPEDKVLSQNETKDVSGEKDKTSVTIDFNLVHN